MKEIVGMLPQLHQHILSELDRTVRADTVFVFGAVVLDVVSIGVNSVLALGEKPIVGVVFWIFLLGVAAVTVIALAALRNGTKAGIEYHEALLALYAREGISDLVPQQAVQRGRTRHRLYSALVAILGGVAVLVPLLIKAAA